MEELSDPAIAFLLKLQEEHLLKQPVLLARPAFVVSNWERDIQKFAPKLKAVIHHGDHRKNGKELWL